MSEETRKLTGEEIESALAELSGWKRDGEAIRRRFEFQDFVEAFGFMSAAALCAERADHHPDWSNTYKTVDVTLSTHELGGITRRDTDLAAEMNRLAGDKS